MDQQRKSSAENIVTRFSDLLSESPNSTAGKQQRLAGELFPSLVAHSHMKVWQAGEPIPQKGMSVLIGVAPSYSVSDLQMLDVLESHLSSDPSITDKIQLLDVSDCKDMAEVKRHFPGIGNVYQTPVVGLWEKGVLIDKAWGAQARKLLEARYGLTLPA